MKTKEARPAPGTWSGKAVTAIRKMAPEAAADNQGNWMWEDGGKEGRPEGACGAGEHWLPGLGTQHNHRSCESMQLPGPPPHPRDAG